MTILRHTVVIASVAWAALLPLAPFAAAQAPSLPGWHVLALVLYAAGHVVCHQLSARSFHLWTFPWAVCARCTGIYAGGALAAIGAVWGLLPRESVAAGRRSLGDDPRRARLLLAGAALPTAATIVFEWTTGRMPPNLLRALAGMPLGAVVVLLLLAACDAGGRGCSGVRLRPHVR